MMPIAAQNFAEEILWCDATIISRTSSSYQLDDEGRAKRLLPAKYAKGEIPNNVHTAQQGNVPSPQGTPPPLPLLFPAQLDVDTQDEDDEPPVGRSAAKTRRKSRLKILDNK
jgi:hypothetical protein